MQSLQFISDETVLQVESNEESDDVDDDVIDLPGGPGDNVDIERLMKVLGDSYEKDDGKCMLTNNAERT